MPISSMLSSLLFAPILYQLVHQQQRGTALVPPTEHEQFAEKMVRDLMWEAGHSGFTPADLADKVGGSPRTYENYKYISMPTLAGFLGIFRTIRPRHVAKKIAEQCGGYFIPLSADRDPGLSTLSKQTSEIMKETADVISAVAKSLEDGQVNVIEKKCIIKEIDEAIEALLRARIGLKGKWR